MVRTPSNLSQKTTVQPTKGDRGEQREGRHANSSKTNSDPRKPQYSQQRRPRGAKRRKTHTLKKNQLRAKKTAVQPTKATEEGAKRREHPRPIPKRPQYSQNKVERVDQAGGRHTRSD